MGYGEFSNLLHNFSDLYKKNSDFGNFSFKNPFYNQNSITRNHIFQVENLLIFSPKESLGGTMGKKEDGKIIFGKLVSPKCTQIPQFTKCFQLKCFTPLSSHIKGTFALVNWSHMQIAKPNYLSSSKNLVSKVYFMMLEIKTCESPHVKRGRLQCFLG